MNGLPIMRISGVDCYEKEGIIYLKLENVARGLGFTHKEVKNGKEYESVRWVVVRSYLDDLGFRPQVGETISQEVSKDSFIPENIFYRLAMKAKNEAAEKFQALVADEIIPSIRKHGAYLTQGILEKALASPDFLIELATRLKEEQEKNQRLQQEQKALEQEAIAMNQTIAKLQPKANYVDMILKSHSTVLTTQIAQDYGMSARAFNKKLSELHIQHKVGRQWILYAEYQGKGYVHSKTIEIVRSNGQSDVTMQTEWTQKGRLFLYEKLKQYHIYPMIERIA